jgi:hypothetical protein
MGGNGAVDSVNVGVVPFNLILLFFQEIGGSAKLTTPLKGVCYQKPPLLEWRSDIYRIIPVAEYGDSLVKIGGLDQVVCVLCPRVILVEECWALAMRNGVSDEPEMFRSALGYRFLFLWRTAS